MLTLINIHMHASLAFEGTDLDPGPSAFKTCPAWPEHVQAANACFASSRQLEFVLQNAEDVSSIHQTLQAAHCVWSNSHCSQTLCQLQTLLLARQLMLVHLLFI